MGIDAHSIRFLREARESGVDFASTITLGCQSLAGENETLAAFTGLAAISHPSPRDDTPVPPHSTSAVSP